MSFNKLSFEVKNEIAYIGFGYNETKSMVVLTEEVLKELESAVDKLYDLKKGKEIKGAIFFSHKEGCFVAGADINLIAGLQDETEGAGGAEQGQQLFNRVEDLGLPTVACIDGFCLGGGLEFALSCTTILASDSKKTKMGLPEVQLGLIPGFGGTYRLPKRTGLPSSLDLILTGKMVDGRKAKKLGIVAQTFPGGRLVEVAPRYINKAHKKAQGFKDKVGNIAVDNFISRRIIFQKARENVLKKTKGFYPAPLKILETMEAGYGKGRAAYLAMESRAFGELCATSQSKNLLHLFFLNEGSKKYNGPKGNGDILKINRGSVLGAGTMGGGIAWIFANNGQAPLMKDLNKDALELGLKQASSNFKGALKRRKLSEDDFERRQRSITPTLNYDGFKKVDLVVEAVVEKMDIKKIVLKETEENVRDNCIITSNTSSLSVTEMATALKAPERFAGLHFFNPVHRMPLVEIITHDKVAPETVEALYKWCLKVKKTPIIVKDGPGFLVNRILVPYMTEALYLMQEGVDPEAIDEAILNFGMPMGAVRLMDEVGIDVMVKVGDIMHEALGAKAKPPAISEKVGELGGFGKKSGKGYYLYDEKGKETGFNPALDKILPKKKIEMDEITIQKRVFLPMINEAAIILAEKLVDAPSTVDLGLIFGIGFPPFRGGLLKYADSEGLDNILAAIESFKGAVDADRYAPAELLQQLVSENRSFYDL